jgi:hypothetical protein
LLTSANIIGEWLMLFGEQLVSTLASKKGTGKPLFFTLGLQRPLKI